MFGNWRGSVNFTWQSGTPFTPRITASAADVARGTNGTLRADYIGGPIRISGPSIDQFFNTAAFAIPLPGTFGNARRNMIIGPGSRLLNGQISRDVPMARNRVGHHPGDRLEPAERRQLCGDRHGGQLADLRPGPVGPRHAVGAAQLPVPVLRRNYKWQMPNGTRSRPPSWSR